MTPPSQPKQSLREYLTIENPSLINHSRKGKATTSKHWLAPTFTRVWDEFTLENLERDYHQVLESRHSLQNFHEIPRFPFREISDEHSLERFLSKWTQSVVCAALEAGQQEETKIYMASGGQAGFRFKKPINVHNAAGIAVRKYYPDWAAVRKDGSQITDQKDVRNLLPGDTKLSMIWHSRKIPTGVWNESEYNLKDVSPILQIFNYCLYTRSSFGYLLSDQELVVVRVTALQSPQESQSEYLKKNDNQAALDNELMLEYRAIPWDGAGDRKLTVNLALWWLHLMAHTNSNSVETDGESASTSFVQKYSDHNLDTSSLVIDEATNGVLLKPTSKRKRNMEDQEPTEVPVKRFNHNI